MPLHACRVVFLLLLCLASPLAYGADEKGVRLRILYTGDRQGRVLAGRNGAPSLAWQVAALRRLRREGVAEGFHVAAVDAGDTLFPALISRIDGGRTILTGLALGGVDLLAPGHHDADRGRAPLLAAARRGGTALVSACLTDAQTGELLLKPYLVIQLGPVRLALIGVARPDLPRASSTKAALEVSVRPANEAVREVVDQLKEGGLADLFVCVGDVDRSQSRSLAAAVPELSAIVRRASREAAALERVEWSFGNGRDPAVPTEVLVSPRLEAAGVGMLDLWLRQRDDGSWALLRARARQTGPQLVVEPDSTIDRLAQALSQRIDRQAPPLIDDFKGLFEGGLSQEALGRAVTALVRMKTDAEVAVLSRRIFNPYAIRRVVESGALRRLDVDQLIEGDDLVVVDLDGQTLADLFNRVRAEEPLYFVGPARGPRGAMTVNGRPIVPIERYRVATSAFLASGRAGYGQFGRALDPRDRFRVGPGGELLADEEEGQPVTVQGVFERFVDREVVEPARDLDRGPNGVAGDRIRLLREHATSTPPLWLLRVENLRATFSSIRAKQNDDFDPVRDKRANADDQEVIAAAGRITLTRASKDFLASLSVAGKFTRIDVDGGDAKTSVDDLRFRAQLTSVYLSFGTPLPGVELAPFGSAELDTEFERPRGSGAHRQKELFLSLGLVTPFPSELFSLFRVGAFGSYNFTDPEDDSWEGGMELEVRHARKLLEEVELNASLRGRWFALNSDTEDGDLSWFAEPSLLVKLPFFLRLTLVVDADAFLFKERGVASVGYHYGISIGLSYSQDFKLRG